MSKKSDKPYSPKITVTAGGLLNSTPDDDIKISKVRKLTEYEESLLYSLLDIPDARLINNISRYDSTCFKYMDDEDLKMFDDEIKDVNNFRTSVNIPEAPIVHTHFYGIPIEQEFAENICRGLLDCAVIISDLDETTDMITIDGDMHFHLVWLQEETEKNNSFNVYKTYISIMFDIENDNFYEMVLEPLADAIKQLNDCNERVYDVEIINLEKSFLDEESSLARWLCLISFKYIDSAIVEIID